MIMKRALSVLLFSLLAVNFLLHSSCANIIPPSGGPRDSLPPRLVMASPKDSATNVHFKNFQLTFDEYVTLQNQVEQVIVSPTVKALPLIDYKLRNVTIRFRDSLEPNTTYSINFGEAIKDVNEGNIARDFRYIFSTGPTIDNNEYSGQVLMAETGKVDSSLIVVLHRDLTDSAILARTPRYYTRVNGKGLFHFQNLAAGTYAVYVVPNDGIRHYTDTSKPFAFRNTPVTVGSITPRDTFYAFTEGKKAQPAISGSRLPAGEPSSRIRYQLKLENGKQDLLSDFQVEFLRKIRHIDTSKIRLYDTLYHAITGYTLEADTAKGKFSISYPWKENMAFRLVMDKTAITDSAGNNLSKTDTLAFLTKRESDYGSIRFRFTGLDTSKAPVLQLVQSGIVVESFVLTRPELVRKLYKPGTYDMRILFDRNRNGVWDTGSFRKGVKKQPEIVREIPRQLSIRGNWDNEATIAL
jgi:hypothetical protein